jgi:hypothetical protein
MDRNNAGIPSQLAFNLSSPLPKPVLKPTTTGSLSVKNHTAAETKSSIKNNATPNTLNIEIRQARFM